MDDLPESAQAFLHDAMRRNRLGVPAIATGIPLSKHIAYKLDTWWVSFYDCSYLHSKRTGPEAYAERKMMCIPASFLCVHRQVESYGSRAQLTLALLSDTQKATGL